MATSAVLPIDPLYLQPKSYDARADRKWFADLISPGVVGAGDFLTTWTTALNFSVAGGVGYVLGGNIADQGMYREYVAGATVLNVGAAHATLPRIDTVVLRVFDNAADAAGFNEARLEVIAGTATGGADLTNLTGKADLSLQAAKSNEVICYILVPAAAVALDATKFRDMRRRASVGSGSAAGAGVPIGTTLEWNSTTLPPSSEGTYLVEDGSAISRTTYATWFSRVGVGFGVGDGSTTANLPDSRGRSVFGWAPSGGHADMSTFGATDGVAIAFRRAKHRTSQNLGISDPGHTHPINLWGTAGPFNDKIARSASFNSVDFVYATNSATTGITLTGGVGTQNANDVLDAPAYIVKNKIIRVA